MSETVKDQLKKLELQEKKEGNSGAVPLTPKQELLAVPDVAAKRPDKHLRWVSTADGQKAKIRQSQGYVKVPDGEGGRTMGNLTLMELPKERAEQVREHHRKLHEARLDAHNREVESAAETVAKHLRDNHGIKIDAKDILIKG